MLKARLACGLLFLQLIVVSITTAADRTDFSGAYTLSGSKGRFKLEKGESWTMQVDQSESGIEVTKVINGKRTRNQFLFNGVEAIYLSPGGIKGVSKAQFKGKILIIDTFVATQPIPNAPSVKLHSRERWELSSGSKTLTIRNEVDSPSVPVGGGFQVLEPWSEIYTRD